MCIRDRVYCKGVYLLVCAGVGDFRMLARVILEFCEGICGLREIDEEPVGGHIVLWMQAFHSF